MIKKSYITLALFSAIIFTAHPLYAQTKTDLYLFMDQEDVGNVLTKSIAAQSKNNADTLHEVLIKSQDPSKTTTAIEDAGGLVHMVSGNIIVAEISTSMIDEISQNEEVVFIEAGKTMSAKNNIAINEINAAEVHSGLNLPAAYAGKGVVVGIIDTGIDYKHPDFLNAEGKNRILAIWGQLGTGGTPPSEIANSYGTECLAASIADGTCPLKDTSGHGSHVAGSAAARNNTYGGVAPDANIIVVSYDSNMSLDTGYADTFFSSKICQAAYYIFAKAQALNMPAVINLSLGTHIGAHDGSSLFEQCLTNLLNGYAGRSIVAAAGNEYSTESYYTGIHAGYKIDSLSATNFVIRQPAKDPYYYIDFWADAGSNLSVGLALHEGAPNGTPLEYSGLVAPGRVKYGNFLNGTISYLINTTETSNLLNGKQHVGIRLRLDPAFKQISKYSLDLVVSGNGKFDAWLFPDKPAKTIEFTNEEGDLGSDWKYVPGDRIKNIAIPATASDIIAVSGYTTRNSWSNSDDCCQVSFELGMLLDFSSSGPTPSPETTGQKPDIAAPGGMIASTLSSSSVPNNLLVMDQNLHTLMAGTSMSAPFVSGTAALILGINPNFTSADIKRVIVSSAYVDSQTGKIPNDRWGAGKLDTLAAVEMALKETPSGNFSQNIVFSEGTASNPSSGGGCEIVRHQNKIQVYGCLEWIIVILTVLFTIRTRQFTGHRESSEKYYD